MSLSHVGLLATSWTAVYQAPPSMGFSRLRVLEWGAIAFSIGWIRGALIESCLAKITLLVLHNPVQQKMTPWYYIGFPGGSDCKESACNAGDPGSTPRLGRSSGEGNGNPLQYSCLENPTHRGAWWATVHGVAVGYD